ncbi:multidrug effflux MFS transporter [Actinotalea ferrariae]|uniref:multidrug effflux MFS transporter n=1 Tax=Actinotalea ferrariae TaxID=1386098 RepID=UPI001FDFCE27|nr:multidrug effflux MFS transporter [Actinotalea ferrariae]
MPVTLTDRTSSTRTAPADRTFWFVLLIGSLTLLPAVTTDMYLPSLPDVAADLSTTPAAAQFTITGMLIGGALGQLVVGPFSDRVGRRLPVLIGVSLHVVVSLLCVVAATIEQLATLRVLQGLVSAGATVVAMAVIRDRYTGAEAARIISRLMLVIAAAPLLAPTAGSVIAAAWGWRAVFVVLALFAALLVVVVALFLPETLPPHRRAAHGLAASFRGYAALLHDRCFVALAVIPGMGLALIISYVAGSSFVFQEQYGLSAQQFALVFALGGTSLVTGSQVNAALVRRFGPLTLLRVGLPVTLAFTAVLAVQGATGIGGLVGLVVAIWFSTAVLGFVMANASALALSRHGERAGTAAAFIGFFQAGLAGAVSTLVGVLGEDALAMTGVMFGSMVVAQVVLALGTPAYRRDAHERLEAVGAQVAEVAPPTPVAPPEPVEPAEPQQRQPVEPAEPQQVEAAEPQQVEAAEPQQVASASPARTAAPASGRP